jgi:hypothetical protein
MSDLDEVMAELKRTLRPERRVRRGNLVTTFGPWSNGHDEQCAIVTHVDSHEGNIPGVGVNLQVFVDEGPMMLASLVPWYPSRPEALEAARGMTGTIGGPKVCWPHED